MYLQRHCYSGGRRSHGQWDLFLQFAEYLGNLDRHTSLRYRATREAPTDMIVGLHAADNGMAGSVCQGTCYFAELDHQINNPQVTPRPWEAMWSHSRRR